MPIRDYECCSCFNKWEELRKDQTDPIRCPKCMSDIIQRVMSSPASFQFKGGGFYQTDYKGKK